MPQWLPGTGPIGLTLGASGLYAALVTTCGAFLVLLGTNGRTGPKYPIIRPALNIMKPNYGRLEGEAFFFSINHPPNSPRGRSDYLTLFDWIDGLERYGYNFLERAENMLNFVWDVTLNGQTEEQIRAWLQNNPPPEPGSLRAHNEAVKWEAISPDLKANNVKTGYDMGQAFIMGAARRPAAWFGGGGKAYQNEAESMDQVPIKDLGKRQKYCKAVATKLCRFVIDQAVLAGRLSEEKAAEGFEITLPEISRKDHVKLVNGVPQLATALSLMTGEGWLSDETATRIIAFVVSQLGFEIDAEVELDRAADRPKEGEEDYDDIINQD